MQLCPHCKTTYPPGIKACPRDGNGTVAVKQDANEDPLIGKFAGSYRLTQKLGEGGMGSVYLAEHPALGKKVAVKILHQEFTSKTNVVERFFSEAKAVSQIGHEHIVDVQDFGILDLGLPYILMELLEGESLLDLFKREQKLSTKRAVDIILQLLDALGAAHERGIIHRDLKPDNIFLVRRSKEEDFVKLLDFGIAKLLDDKSRSNAQQPLTQTGTVVGTPQYMSPEQAQGHISDIDARSDLYSVGVILFELLTGQLPFAETSFGDLVISHVLKPPPAPRSINPAISRPVEQVILKAMAKKREERYANAAEMAEALRKAPQLSSHIEPIEFSLGLPAADSPTTLSGITGEITALKPAGRRLALLLSAVGVVAGALGASFLVKSYLSAAAEPKAAVAARPIEAPPPSAPASAPQSASAPVVEEAPKLIPLTILSEPKGAKVSARIDGGEPLDLGKTPATLELLPGAKVELSFSKDKLHWKERLVAREGAEALTSRYVAPKKGGSDKDNNGAPKTLYPW